MISVAITDSLGIIIISYRFRYIVSIRGFETVWWNRTRALTGGRLDMHNTVVLDQKRWRFIRGSDARVIMGDDEAGLLRLWRDMRHKVEREGLPLAGRMPIGWHVVAVCYAAAAIFLGWWPWNFLLLLLVFPIRNKRVRLYAFRTTRSNGPGPERARVSCARGSSL
jgi:hypothetical protein